MYTYTYNKYGVNLFKDGIFLKAWGTDTNKKQHYKIAKNNCEMYKLQAVNEINRLITK